MTTEGVFPLILVPTDFSAGSEHAWSLAQRMAATLNAELILLHVLPETLLDLATRLEERKAGHRARHVNRELATPCADEDDEPTPRQRVYVGPLTREEAQEFSAASRERAAELEQWAAAGRAAGCKVRTLLRVGVPYREVVLAAQEEHADLVLLATHGRGEIHRLLVGSVADRVIRMAPCPVLTIKRA